MNNEDKSKNKKIKIAAIVGPTAGGKTALSIEMAKRFDGEIISCDSMQIYRGMDIGTAKPTEAEKCGIPHHMIDVADPRENFSCADYVEAARKCINDISDRGKLPIFCGGTGMYLDSLMRESSFESTPADPLLRDELEKFAKENGNAALYARLEELDPESAAVIHQNNVKRVARAIEICLTTGEKKSELDKRSQKSDGLYDCLTVGLRYTDRNVIRERIDKRVDLMMSQGLEDEVRRLYSSGMLSDDKNSTASQAIGYKEMIAYIKGECTLEDAVGKIKLATAKYSKRQMTWFNYHGNVNWIDVTGEDGMLTFEKIVNISDKLFRNHVFCDIIK